MRENAGQLRELLVTDPVRFLIEAVCFAHDSHEHQKLMLRQTCMHYSLKDLIGDARKPIIEICHARLLMCHVRHRKIDYFSSVCHNYSCELIQLIPPESRW